MQGHKTSLCEVKRIEIIQSVYSLNTWNSNINQKQKEILEMHMYVEIK